MKTRLSGLFVAPVTPLNSRGKIDFRTVQKLLEFLIESGVDGICVSGATGEYPHFSYEERKQLISCAAEKTRGRAILLVAIGSSTLHQVLALGAHASSEGAQAVLLPTPYFYDYEQDDLETFCRVVSRSLSLPCLLYNLPDFTNPLDLETSARLLLEEPGIVGIKDSSGDREALTRLTQVRRQRDVSLLIGRDSLVFLALNSGWDGIVSGAANLCPELLVKEYQSFRAGDQQTAKDCQQRLDMVSAELRKLPVPWGIRAGLEARGILTGPLPLPVSERRKEQLRDFLRWFEGWLQEHLAPLVEVQK